MTIPRDIRSEEAVPQRRPGCLFYALTGCAVLAGIFLLVVIVLSVGIGYWATDLADHNCAVVRRNTAKITEIVIPSQFVPQFTYCTKIPLTGKPEMSVAVYGDEQGYCLLALAGFDRASAENFEEGDFFGRLDESLSRWGKDRQGVLPDRSREHARQIRGQKAVFRIVHGRGAGSGRRMISVEGVFRGQNGPAVLAIQANADKYVEDQLVQIVDSIK